MGSFVGECAIDVSAGTCAPEVHDDDHSSLVYVFLFVWCTAMTLLLAAAVWIGIKRIRAIEADAGHLALQVVQADTTLGETHGGDSRSSTFNGANAQPGD